MHSITFSTWIVVKGTSFHFDEPFFVLFKDEDGIKPRDGLLQCVNNQKKIFFSFLSHSDVSARYNSYLYKRHYRDWEREREREGGGAFPTPNHCVIGLSIRTTLSRLCVCVGGRERDGLLNTESLDHWFSPPPPTPHPPKKYNKGIARFHFYRKLQTLYNFPWTKTSFVSDDYEDRMQNSIRHPFLAELVSLFCIVTFFTFL